MTDIMLFAAGLGTRMRPLTDHLPKSLVPVGNTTLFDHAYGLTEVPQVTNRVVNVHYRADQMREHVADRPVTISDETDLLRDTGGGLKHALPLLQSDPVLTLNTDAVWSGPNPINVLMDAWQDHMTCLLMLVPQDQTFGHPGKGDFLIGPDGQLTRGRGPVYTGLQMIRTSALSRISEPVFSMNVVWDVVGAEGGLYGCLYPGTWCDVGQPSSLDLAESLLNDSAHV